MTPILASEIVIRAIFWTSLLFIGFVSTFWPWWRTQLGWSIIAKTFALTVAVLPAMLSFWFGHAPPEWTEWVTLGALATVPVIIVWRAYVLWQIQRRRKGQPL